MNFTNDQSQNSLTKKNITGIPDDIKESIENSSGYSMDDVRVHYDSEMPKRISALAYTQGNEIYIAPGQEKHLEHELGHVVQQKQGRVTATEERHGNPVNTNTALEEEADNSARKSPSKRNPMFLKDFPLSSSQQPIQMMSEKESVFDFKKLKTEISLLIIENLNKPGWPLAEVKDPELTLYAEQVHTLLEDIRQVDLQFLTATALAYEEDTQPAIKTKENALTKEEEDLFGQGKNKVEDLKQQQLYKGIVLDKLEYIGKIRQELQERLKYLKSEYLISIRNHGSAKKQKTVNRFKKIMDEKKSKYDITGNYLKDVDTQVKLLEGVAKNATKNGYVFNQNTLLSQIDGKIQLYMAVVAPSKTDQHKDVTQDEDGSINTKGSTLQSSISTPVRAFSWMTKYAMDPSAKANTPPMIRALEAEPEALEGWHETASSEQFKVGDHDTHMNEDFKVPNQYGTPKDSKAYKKLEDSKPELTTYTEPESMPKSMQEGSGVVKSTDDFKKFIGFSRSKDDTTKATDVHFFDHEHTAFHEIDGTGKPALYPPLKAKALSEDYNKKMDRFIWIMGEDAYVDNAVKKGIITIKKPQNQDVRNELKILLEANHCLPPGSKTDLHGNSLETLKSEQDFALKHIGESTEDIDNLIDLTQLRYAKWVEDLLNPVDSKKRPLKGHKLKEYRSKRIGPFLESGGLRSESELLSKEYPKDNKVFDLQNLIKSQPDIDKCFTALRDIASSKDTGNKVHVTAFCFKLLRTIMDTSISPPGSEEPPVQEDDLFSQRVSGDYYDVLNRQDQKVVESDETQIVIPFDKMTSKNRFKPKGDAPKIEQIPFVGGASGTTRDMTRDIMAQGQKDTKHNWLKDSKDYWKFQLMNAAFMITYDYHSFVEVFYRAATTRLEYDAKDAVAKEILDYLQSIKDNKFPNIKNNEIIDAISKMVNRM